MKQRIKLTLNETDKNVYWPSGSLRGRKLEAMAIKAAREAIEAPFRHYVVKMDGRVIEFFGTYQNKSGYSRRTYKADEVQFIFNNWVMGQGNGGLTIVDNLGSN